MENASKALLIAGAILIAIVLISLGVMILGQGSDLVKNTNMSSTEITTYNSEFETYLGASVRGSSVRQLISKIEQHNRENSQDISKQIAISLGAKANDKEGKDVTESDINANIKSSAISTGYAYKVEATYNTGGLIAHIFVLQN